MPKYRVFLNQVITMPVEVEADDGELDRAILLIRRLWPALDKALSGRAAELRKARVEALREAADALFLPAQGPAHYVDIDYAEQLAKDFLSARADEMEGSDHE
jgi:hypothetical protein